MKPGDLVQLRDGVLGQGEIGILIGPNDDPSWGAGLVRVLFHDGIDIIHPTNLHAPVVTGVQPPPGHGIVDA